MKIVVLEGSPNKNGSSNMLAKEFIRGAQEAGHSVEVVDTAHANIHPCTGCVHCGYEGPCVQKDDVEQIRGHILGADMIDRFCAFNSSIQGKGMKAAILSAAWNSDNWTFDALEAHYETLLRYLNLTDMGRVWGRGCGTPSMTKHSRYMRLAYELGKNLR